MLGCHALHDRELGRVGGGLEQGGRLDPAGQLRVEHLVAERAEVGGRVDAAEEVGVAEPAAVEERGLVHELGAGPQGGLGVGRGPAQAGERAVVAGDLDHLSALAPEPVEVGVLVLDAARAHHLELGVVPLGPGHQPSGRGQLELGEVLAREVAGEVARAQDDLAVDQLHEPEYGQGV